MAVRGVTPAKEGTKARQPAVAVDQFRWRGAVRGGGQPVPIGRGGGNEELARLSYHSNLRWREQAVKEMGLSGQTRFVRHLVTLGWTEQNEQVRRAILEARTAGASGKFAPRVGGLTAWDAKIRCWVEWFESRNGTPARNVPAGAPLASRPGRES